MSPASSQDCATLSADRRTLTLETTVYQITDDVRVLTQGAQAAGNSQAAQACQQGGYRNYVRSDGTPFANPGECASYAAQGGTLLPKPTARITDVFIYASGSYTQAAAVTGTGFLPNHLITFDVTFGTPGPSNYSTLNGASGVYTDATGAFNNGTDTRTYILLSCDPNTITVTATDGTNTATYSTPVPACP